MTAPRSSPPPRRRWWVLALVGLALVAALGWSLAQRHVYRVTLAPGASTSVRVTVPMQRFGRPKTFVRNLSLPVRCTVTAPPRAKHELRATVVETGHGVHKMWARVLVVAGRGAKPGRHVRTVTYTIDGEGDWPKAKIVARVRADD